MHKFPQDLHIFLVALDTICGFRWVKKVDNFATKYISVVIYFW